MEVQFSLEFSKSTAISKSLRSIRPSAECFREFEEDHLSGSTLCMARSRVSNGVVVQISHSTLLPVPLEELI